MQIGNNLRDPSVSESQNWTCVEFFLTGAAAGTKLALLPEQQIAASKVHCLVGNTTADVLTAAQATELVRGPTGNVSAEAALNATQLVAFLSDIPAAIDNGRSIAFAIGGLSGIGKVLAAQIEWNSIVAVAANSQNSLRRAGPAKIGGSTVTLTYASDGLVFFPECSVLAGCFTLSDAADVPVANTPVTLRVWIKA